MDRKKLISVVLSVVLTITSVPPKTVEASWFSDFFGAVFTVITAPIWVFCSDNPTFRKNNPFRTQKWEEDAEKETTLEEFRKKLYKASPAKKEVSYIPKKEVPTPTVIPSSPTFSQQFVKHSFIIGDVFHREEVTENVESSSLKPSQKTKGKEDGEDDAKEQKSLNTLKKKKYYKAAAPLFFHNIHLLRENLKKVSIIDEMKIEVGCKFSGRASVPLLFQQVILGVLDMIEPLHLSYETRLEVVYLRKLANLYPDLEHMSFPNRYFMRDLNKIYSDLLEESHVIMNSIYKKFEQDPLDWRNTALVEVVPAPLVTAPTPTPTP
jgi:hypothetical protein